MHIVQELQKLIYGLLKSMSSEMNIYSCPNKNVDFPYAIIELDKINMESNFNNNLYEIIMNIKIFDKNETNIKITQTGSNIQKEILKLFNIEIKSFKIIDVISVSDSLKMYNELNSVWNEVLSFKFIIDETKI